MSSRRIWMHMAIVVLLFAGCASRDQKTLTVAPKPQKTLIVVAPDRDGKVGTVAVTNSRGETLIDKPYAAVSADKDGRMETLPMTGEKVQVLFREALAVRPERPVSYTLYFREGSDELTAESKQRLTEVLAEISHRGSNVSEVTVVGHTDRMGTTEFNDRLSLQRSQRIADEFMLLGVSPDAIAAAGRGEREPLIPTEDEVAEPRNRRVDITVR